MRQSTYLLYTLGICVAFMTLSPRELLAEEEPSPFASVEVIEERLPNGLTLIMSPDHRLPTVAVEVRYLVGSGHEPEGRSGFAHLFEHLMFQGSKSYDHEYFDPFSPIGGRVNGTTNVDRTNYYEQVPAEALELALWMESDRMEGLLEVLTEEKLNNQRDVVKNERRQRYENTPYGMVWKLLYEEMFPKGHPYQHTTIGSHEDLTAATLEDVKTFFKTYYAPANATLTIVGDFEPEEARALVYRYFATIPAGERAPRPQASQPTRSSGKLITVRDQVKLPRVYLAWHSPALYAKGDSEMDLLATLLSEGKTSRLYQPLVFESKLAKDVAAFQMSMGLSSLFVVYATAAPGVKIEALEASLTQELANALKRPASEDEFSRALNGWQKSFYHRVEGVMSRAQMMSNYAHWLGTPSGFSADLKRYTDLTPASVFEETQRWIHDQPLRVRFIPKDSEGYEPPNRKELPTLKESASWSPPAVSEWTTPNGIKVMHVEQRQAPLVTVSLILPHGADTDPAERAGLSALTVSMLDEGADGRSALELSDAFQRLATDYSSRVSSTSTTFNLSCLAHQLSPSLELLNGILTRPNLEQADFDRLQKQYIAQALSAEADPRATRNLVMKRVLFGDGFFGLPSNGLPDTLEAVTLADVKRHHQALVSPVGATLIVTGAVDRATLEGALSKSLGAWRATQGAQLVTRPLTLSQEPPVVHWVDFPGSSQSAIAVVRAVGGTKDAQSPLADELFNRVFGGDFTSRLNMNLREDKGYTYGAYSGLYQNAESGIWFMGAMVKGETTSASLTEINKELELIMSEGSLTQEELDRARNGLLKGFPNRFEKISSVASTLSELVSEGRGPAWMTAWSEGMPKVTLKQVLNSGAQLTPARHLQVIIAGDLTKHGASVAELGMSIQTYNARGERVGAWSPQTLAPAPAQTPAQTPAPAKPE